MLCYYTEIVLYLALGLICGTFLTILSEMEGIGLTTKLEQGKDGEPGGCLVCGRIVKSNSLD